MEHLLRHKRYSVFGDSISTLHGFQPESYAVEYEGAVARDSGVQTFDDTWWGMVINALDGELLVNDAYSGCMVTSGHRWRMAFPSAASEERIEALCSPGNPDVLMVYLGTNDWGRYMDVEDWKQPWWRTFAGSYDHMLHDLRLRMPDTEIWCLNLTYSKRMMYYFYQEALERIVDYNRAIARAVQRHGARLVDLWANASAYSSVDLAHPDRVGMQTIANAVLQAVSK